MRHFKILFDADALAQVHPEFFEESELLRTGRNPWENYTGKWTVFHRQTGKAISADVPHAEMASALAKANDEHGFTRVAALPSGEWRKRYSAKSK